MKYKTDLTAYFGFTMSGDYKRILADYAVANDMTLTELFRSMVQEKVDKILGKEGKSSSSN